jgi:hypothetical protein
MKELFLSMVTSACANHVIINICNLLNNSLRKNQQQEILSGKMNLQYFLKNLPQLL